MLWLDGAVEQPWWQSIRQRDVQVHFLQCLIPLVDCFSCTTMNFQPPKHPWIIHSFRSLLIASLAELTYHRPACTKPRWSSSSSSQHLSMNLRHLGWWVFVKTQNIHTYLHARSCDALPELFFLSFWLIAWSKKSTPEEEDPPHHTCLLACCREFSFPLVQNQTK